MEEIMLTLQNVSYLHPDKSPLFQNLNLSIGPLEKVALIGNNGTGKSTLLKIIAGLLVPSAGVVTKNSAPYYVPQHFGQFNDSSVAQALHVNDKITALHEILEGNITDSNLAILNEDWTIEDRCVEAFEFWNLSNITLTQTLASLSGGEKTKVFLAGIRIHDPEIILLDEPTNHLDTSSREHFYRYVENSKKTLVVVSHDRTLLSLLPFVYELEKGGIKAFGGNYDFYKEQKFNEAMALGEDLQNQRSSFRKAKKKERETLERKQKQEVRGKKNFEKGGGPKIAKKKMKDNAEKSSTRLTDAHSDKLASMADEIAQTRQKLSPLAKMKMDFESSALHTGKILVRAQGIQFGYGGKMLWREPMSFEIRSGERIHIQGANGSGKTTLIKIMLGEIQPIMGTMDFAYVKMVYIDQDYSLILNDLTVYEMAQKYNSHFLPEGEIKIRLSRFLFRSEFWDKLCGTLSGGEKMRLMLCCLAIGNQAPDLFILDEPTNNLDIQNVEILTQAMNEYRGTVIVVSHDSTFLADIGVDHSIKVGHS
jgi:ATPase subunit of ABC transporter with duplicated ATPase domains